MIDTAQIDRIEGSTAYADAGERVGHVGELYLDQSGTPSWVTVAAGLLGTSETFAPLEGASFDGQDLRLAYSKDAIKNAPRYDTDEHLGQAEDAELSTATTAWVSATRRRPAATSPTPPTKSPTPAGPESRRTRRGPATR